MISAQAMLSYAQHIFLRGYKTLCHTIAPPFCYACKQFLQKQSPFCDQCITLIKPIATITLPLTASKAMKIFAVADYQEPLKSLILAKHKQDIIAGTQLGQLLWDMTNLKHASFDYIVPVPLHWQRFAKRGFNQAQEMAHVLATLSGKPVLHALSRVRATKPQSECSREERLENMAAAFVCNKAAKDLCHQKTILLVDDVVTTGATLVQAAKALLAAKPDAIIAGVACHTLR